MPAREIEVDGRRFGWRAVGREPGAAAGQRLRGDEQGGTRLLVRLARSHPVICPDNRGLGGSELGDPS